MARGHRKKRKYQVVGNLALAEPPDVSAQIAVNPAQLNPQEEYLSGNYYGQEVRFLPAAKYEQCAPEITFETYRQMLHDPEIAADIWLLKYFVLADGLQLTLALDGVALDADSQEFSQAQEIATFCERNFAGLRKPLEDTLEQMLDAISYGHKVAEITWKDGEGQDSGKLVLDKIAPKPHNVLEFVVDQFNNLLGFTPKTYTRTTASLTGRQILPAEKFLLLTLREEDDDPRGNPGLRPAYNGWNFKQLTWPEYKRWLENCAMPSLIGKTAPKGQSDVQRNPDGTKLTGGKLLSSSEAMLQALLNLKNASAAVVPNGAEVDQIEPTGEGAGFERAINVADGQITKGILFQSLATNEAQFGTRAQSETHMGVLDLLVWYLKGKVGKLLTGLIERVITYNFGKEALRFTPIVAMGDTERRDWATDATAAAALETSLTDSQWLHITTQLGIPAPAPGERPRREAVVEQMADRPPAAPPTDDEQSARWRRRLSAGRFLTLRRAA